jgi:hypothetical protein
VITQTAFEQKNEILRSPALQEETGFARLPNGDYLVSMTCPMPNVTPKMIRWWFWWHPQKSERYRAWFPGEHVSISYSRKDAAYFGQKALPPFQPNTQYPVERIGKIKMPLRIDFIESETFGFCQTALRQAAVPLIVCGHVSAYKGLIPHTEMAHIFRQETNGLFLISRFWIGQRMTNPVLRKAFLTDRTAADMAAHCRQEYRNLAAMLPALYQKEMRRQATFGKI